MTRKSRIWYPEAGSVSQDSQLERDFGLIDIPLCLSVGDILSFEYGISSTSVVDTHAVVGVIGGGDGVAAVNAGDSNGTDVIMVIGFGGNPVTILIDIISDDSAGIYVRDNAVIVIEFHIDVTAK